MSNESSRQQTPDVQPAIAELLRTCVHPPVLSLHIDHVVRTPAGDGGIEETDCYRYTTKLFLTDGELLIQALLNRKLSTLPEIEDLDVGDIVEIHDFTVKKARRKNGRGHVVYLGVDNCYVIKQEKTIRSKQKMDLEMSITPTRKRKRTVDDPNQDDSPTDLAGGFVREESTAHTARAVEVISPLTTKSPNKSAKLENLAPVAALTPPYSRKKPKHITIMVDSDEDDGFETVDVDMGTIKKRRQALHELDRNIISSPSKPPMEEHSLPQKDEMFKTIGNSTVQGLKFLQSANVAANRSHSPFTDISDNEQATSNQTSLLYSQIGPWGSFHNLASLFSPLLPKSTTITTLAIPTSISTHLITRPNQPLPPKRHLKILDPTLADRLSLSGTLRNRGITVSVYRDALNFKPTIGRVALLRGLVMQRLKNGEVILNIYPAKSRIQKQSQSRSQSRPPSRHAHFADDPVIKDRPDPIKWDQMNMLKRESSVIESEEPWFIDDHDKLRELGYDVDTMQAWWNRHGNERR